MELWGKTSNRKDQKRKIKQSCLSSMPPFLDLFNILGNTQPLLPCCTSTHVPFFGRQDHQQVLCFSLGPLHFLLFTSISPLTIHAYCLIPFLICSHFFSLPSLWDAAWNIFPFQYSPFRNLEHSPLKSYLQFFSSSLSSKFHKKTRREEQMADDKNIKKDMETENATLTTTRI